MKKCKDCKGRGRWQETDRQIYSDGSVSYVEFWNECNTCHGTGVQPDLDDEHAPENTFDIAGSSYYDED